MGAGRSRARGGSLGGVLVLSLLASGCIGSGGSEESTTASPSSTSTNTTSSASDGDCDAEVEVVEKGFTVIPDSEGVPKLSLAVVVENPGDLLAVDTEVEVIARDVDGDPISPRGAESARFGATIDSVPPGERQGNSSITFLESSGVETVDVRVRSNRWAKMDEENQQVRTKGATILGNRIEFTAEPPSGEPVNPAKTYALFRSSSGELVGGSTHADGPQSYPPMSTTMTMGIGKRSRTPLPEDVEKVEVYVDHQTPDAEPAKCPDETSGST